MESDEAPPAGVRFKSKKRTKTLRQRDASPVAEAASAPSPVAASAPRDTSTPDDNDRGGDEDDAESAVLAALKLRQARSRNRFRGGVGFGRDEAGAETSDNAETGLVLREAAATQGLPDRFMHQTGFVADADDKHMMAYVEARLSSRGGGDRTAEKPAEVDEATKQTQQQPETRRQGVPGTMQSGTSTTSWTKLVEVEVPADLHASNNNNNNAHARNANGRKRGATDTEGKQPPRRRRNRRGSDDVKRDAMVEAFLSENKLDVYDVPTASSSSVAAAGDPSRSADDVLAENFRQQYMEEQAARRQRKRPAINQPRLSQKQQAHQQAVAAGEVLKGPKLGGSRNARAAVRDALLQQQELGKKK